MDLDCPTFLLTPPWEAEKVLLAHAPDAFRLCGGGGYEAMDAGTAQWEFARLGRLDTWDLRRFVAQIRLSRFPLSSLGDTDLVELVGTCIKRCELVALRRGSSVDGVASPTAELRRLVREIEAKSRGRLTEEGRHYKLVADLDWAQLPSRDSYHVVPRDDAQKVLDALAMQPGISAALAALLVKARDKLTRDWRLPLSPDGMVLLRRAPAMASSSTREMPALSPSQLRKSALTWITVEFVDEQDEPWDGAADLTLPDGLQRTVTLSDEGVIDLQEIAPGTVTVKFPGSTAEDDEKDSEA